MSNAIIPLVVPGIDNTVGPATDVSTLAGTVSIEISGTYRGSYTILGSQDGVLFVPRLWRIASHSRPSPHREQA